MSTNETNATGIDTPEEYFDKMNIAHGKHGVMITVLTKDGDMDSKRMYYCIPDWALPDFINMDSLIAYVALNRSERKRIKKSKKIINISGGTVVKA